MPRGYFFFTFAAPTANYTYCIGLIGFTTRTSQGPAAGILTRRRMSSKLSSILKLCGKKTLRYRLLRLPQCEERKRFYIRASLNTRCDFTQMYFIGTLILTDSKPRNLHIPSKFRSRCKASMQSTNRSPSPGGGVHTRRGTASNDPPRTDDGTLLQTPVQTRWTPIVIPSSEDTDVAESSSSYVSSERDSAGSEPLSEGSSYSQPQQINNPRQLPHVEDPAGSPPEPIVRPLDVQSAVYYFANTLRPILRTEMYSLPADHQRTKMIIKWMRFYRYYPNWPKEIDTLRRQELKDHLNLPPSFGQKLASCLINKFNQFEKTGLVSKPHNGAAYASYSTDTDIWLSSKWDGLTDPAQQRVSVERNHPTRLPSRRAMRKRSASVESANVEKRHKPSTKVSEKLDSAAASENITIIVDTPPAMRQGEVSKPNASSRSVSAVSREEILRLKKTQIGRREQDYTTVNTPVSDSNRIPTGLIFTAEPTVNATPGQASCHPSDDTHPDYRRLFQLPQKVQQQQRQQQHIADYPAPIDNSTPPNCVSEGLDRIQNDSLQNKVHVELLVPFACLTQDTSKLGHLKEKEKTFVQALEESMQEWTTETATYKQLCHQRELLKTNLISFRKELDDALKSQQPLASGTRTAETTKSLDDALKASRKVLRYNEERKVSLAKQISKQIETLSGLETCVSQTRVQLKDVQDEIGELRRFQKQKCKGVAFLEDFDSALSGHDDSTFQSTLEPMAPPKCLSEMSSSEDEESEDEDGLFGDSMLANCTAEL